MLGLQSDEFSFGAEEFGLQSKELSVAAEELGLQSGELSFEAKGLSVAAHQLCRRGWRRYCRDALHEHRQFAVRHGGNP